MSRDRDRRYLRVSLACLLGAAVTLYLCSSVYPGDRTTPPSIFTSLVGLGSTSGLGEDSPAPELSLLYSSSHFEIEGTWYGARKLESDGGWGVRGGAEARWRAVGVGLSYTYRDGGEWVKHYPWARGSVRGGPFEVIGEWALGGFNKERRVEVRVEGTMGHLVVQPRVFVTKHVQGTGWGATMMVGWRVKGGGE